MCCNRRATTSGISICWWKTPGSSIRQEDLDLLVDIQTWGADKYELANFTDDELIPAIKQLAEAQSNTSTEAHGWETRLRAELQAARTAHQEIRVPIGRMRVRNDKVELAKLLWPVLVDKCERELEQDDVRTPVLKVVLRARELVGQLLGGGYALIVPTTSPSSLDRHLGANQWPGSRRSQPCVPSRPYAGYDHRAERRLAEPVWRTSHPITDGDHLAGRGLLCPDTADNATARFAPFSVRDSGRPHNTATSKCVPGSDTLSDVVPLKHILEPGQYRVEWTLPGQTGDVVTLQGDLVLQANRPPRGDAYGNVPLIYEEAGNSRWVPFPQTYTPSLVTGRLLNGLLVILVDPVVALWTRDRARIHARAALVGRAPSAPTTIRASQMTMQVTGLDAVSGIGPLRQFKFPQGTDGRQYLDWAWEAVGRPESTQTWSDGSAEAELWFRNSFNVSTAYHFRLAFSPVVQATFSEPLDFDTALNDWATPLCNLVALSTGRLEKITYLDLQLDVPGSQPATLQVYGLGLHQKPCYSDPGELQKAQPNFFLANEDTGLLTLLRRWQKLTAEHHPLLETYASLMFVADQHPRSRFQLLIQAIEGLHGVETQEDFVSRSLSHGERRAAVLEEAAQVLGADSMKFLKKFLAKRPISGLDPALHHIFDSAPINVRPLLEDTDLIREAMSIHSLPLIPCLRQIRNDLSHGSRGYDPQGLHEVANLLDGVVHAHLLRVLGCSELVQERAQKQRR
ncbi:hypothetical protein ITP53_33785 [Nonomuraea sp. K274]|uniref:ApeA N-terminal domain-containing protein n=1 Tax=Nonomuraea cypriaca TaxID=1187855 RepID=A0A931AGG2_9ACTN|nr:hypothetical protein [Nonomuraea cypriaca]